MEEDNNTILVITSEKGVVRGGTVSKLRIEDLSENVNQFLQKMGKVLEKSPDILGKYGLAEFEVSAEINAKGSIALLGTGGEAGAKSGLKFVFRRQEDSAK